MTTLNFNQFCDSKKALSKEDWADKYGVDSDTIEAQSFLEYAHCCYIEVLKDGEYFLELNRDSWQTKDVKELEDILYYQWYLYECVSLQPEQLETFQKTRIIKATNSIKP